MSENVKLRRELEKAILVALLEEARAEGYRAYEVDDGGDERVKVQTEAETIDAVFAVDDATVFFIRGTHRTWVRLIGGNGQDFLSDYGVNFDPVCSRVYARIKEVTVVLPRPGTEHLTQPVDPRALTNQDLLDAAYCVEASQSGDGDDNDDRLEALAQRIRKAVQDAAN